MVSVTGFSVVHRGFESLLDQIKDCKIGIGKHAALLSKNKH